MHKYPTFVETIHNDREVLDLLVQNDYITGKIGTKLRTNVFHTKNTAAENIQQL